MTPPSASPALRWAIVGPGRIAHRFAQAVLGLPDARLVAVHGRNRERAEAFAQQWQPSVKAQTALQVTPTLGALVNCPDVDAVYVATPHSHHGEAVQASLRAGKAVLCEKSLVASADEAEPLLLLSRTRHVFLMEALWTRFLPIYAQVGAWLRSGAIGPLRGVHSSFCFAPPFDPASRLFNPALAGGALLDIGIYNLSVLRWVLQQATGTAPGAGPEPESWHVSGQRAATGVDLSVAGLLGFADGVSATFRCALDSRSANALHIEGRDGHIVLPHNFWQATQAELHRADAPVQRVDAPFAINGFEGQIEEATRCIRAGLFESPVMPHAETLATLRWMDRMRAELGVRYPFEGR
jgi:predicted dehydrogenase